MYFPQVIMLPLCRTVCTSKKAAKLCPDAETAVILHSKRSMPIVKMLKYPTPIKPCNNPASNCTPLKIVHHGF